MAAYSALANKRNIVNLLFFFLFASILFAATPNFHSYYNRGIKNTTYMFLAGVALFFIHNMVLAPIKLKENNNRKYIILITACIIIFATTEAFLFTDIIKRMSNPGSNIFGIVPDQLLSLGALFKIIGAVSIPLLIIGVLSVIYTLLVYGFRAISPYLESFVHIIVLTLIFAFIVTFPDLKSKEISVIIPLILAFYTNTFFNNSNITSEQKDNNLPAGIINTCFRLFSFSNHSFDIIRNSKVQPGNRTSVYPERFTQNYF